MAIVDSRPLSNSIGTVLDPIFSLRRRIRVAPGATVRIAYLDDRCGQSRSASRRRRQAPRRDRIRRAPRRSPGPRARCSCTISASPPAKPSLFQRLAGHVIYARPRCARPRRRFSAGRAHSRVCGARAFPAICRSFSCASPTSKTSKSCEQLLQAHEYWRMKQLAVDLVILNERRSSYVQELQIAIETLVRTSRPAPLTGTEHRRGRVFLLRADLIVGRDESIFSLPSRGWCLSAQRGRLFEQLERIAEPAAAESACAEADHSPFRGAPDRPPALDLEFFNGLGGFARDGREYVTVLGPGQSTPAPWINVIANPAFGFQVGGRGQRLHLVRQQPGESAHAVVERSGQRSSGRGVLSARRGNRRALDARRRCRSATSRRPMSPATATATAGSSMSRTGSRPICCSSCRSTIRSRFPASC